MSKVVICTCIYKPYDIYWKNFINSLNSQTDKNFKVVFYFDGDKSPIKFKNDIKFDYDFIVANKNKGLLRSRLELLRCIDGDHKYYKVSDDDRIAWIDIDDVVSKDYVELINKYDNYDVINLKHMIHELDINKSLVIGRVIKDYGTTWNHLYKLKLWRKFLVISDKEMSDLLYQFTDKGQGEGRKLTSCEDIILISTMRKVNREVTVIEIDKAIYYYTKLIGDLLKQKKLDNPNYIHLNHIRPKYLSEDNLNYFSRKLKYIILDRNDKEISNTIQ